MTRSRIGRRGLLTIAAVVIASILGTAVAVPTIRQAMAGTPPPTPLIVTISRPGPAAAAAVGFPVGVSAHALGATGLARLELWAGERLVEATDLDGSKPAAVARWRWTPEAAGDVLLIGRAIDRFGRTAQSNIVRLSVLAQIPDQLELRDVIADGTRSVAQLVASIGGDVDDALRFDGSLRSSDVPTAGTSIAVPIRVPGPPTAASTDAGPRDAAAVAMDPVADVRGPLAPPVLHPTIDGCTLRLRLDDRAATARGLAVYLAAPFEPGLHLVRTLPSSRGSGQTLSLPLGPGSNLLTASAYDETSEVQSAPVLVTVPDSCGSSGWTGRASIVGGVLHVDASVDRAYVYLSIDGDPWQRVPADPKAFIQPIGGALDARAYLPPTRGSHLTLHAWGWQGGTLVDLGSGDYAPQAQTQTQTEAGLGAVFGAGTVTTLDGIKKQPVIKDVFVVDPDATPDPALSTSSVIVSPYDVGTIERPTTGHSNFTAAIKREFHWTTKATGVDHLIWQVLPYPPPSHAVLEPPFLIDAGCLPVGAGQSDGEFTIDFRPYFDHPYDTPGQCQSKEGGLIQQLVPGGITQPVGGSSGQGQVDVAKPVLPGATGGSTGGSTAAGPIAGSVGVAGLVPTTGPLFAPPDHLYVQVIAMHGTSPVGPPSDPVRFDVVDAAPDLVIDPSLSDFHDRYEIQAWVAIPKAADPKYARCVRVDDTPNHGSWSYTVGGLTFGTYAPGQVLCYVPPDDSGWDPFDAFVSFVEYVAGVWDYVVEAYDWIQDQVVALVVTALQCEQVMSKEQCTMLAKTALHAVMVAFGVPPSLPDFKSTMAALKGDLADYVVAQLGQQYPAIEVACDAAKTAESFDSDAPTCEEYVEKAVDAIADEIVQTQSDSAAATTGVFVPPGVIVAPDPRGSWSPPAFRFRLTGTAKAPPPGPCSVSLSMDSSITNATWKEVHWVDKDYDQDGIIDATHVQTYVQVSGSAKGSPFQPRSVSVPSLAPGESWPATSDPSDPQTWHGVWLMDPALWFESYPAKQYAQWEEGASSNHAWKLLGTGATVTMRLGGTCNTSLEHTDVLAAYAGQ